MNTDAVAAIEFLARSRTRVRLLQSLTREQQLSKQGVHDAVDASRTTIQRNLHALEDRGWIRTRNSEYAITTAGEWIAEDFSTLVGTIRTVQRLGPILDLGDTSTFGFDLRDVAFEITTADPGHPQKMIYEHVQSIRDTDELCLLLPETAVEAMEAVRDRVLDHDAAATLIVSVAVRDAVESDPDLRDCVATLEAVKTFRFLVTEREIPYYLGQLDDTVEIGISENSQPRALLSTTDTEVREWADRTLAEYESTATPAH